MSIKGGVKFMFQSTHSRRVRLAGVSFALPTPRFNPRTHEECDPLRVWHPIPGQVSIHALTKSATWFRRALPALIALFQSTHSRRVRQVSKNLKRLWRSFNPRTHEECDSAHNHTANKPGVSIHALTKSATISIYSSSSQR